MQVAVPMLPDPSCECTGWAESDAVCHCDSLPVCSSAHCIPPRSMTLAASTGVLELHLHFLGVPLLAWKAVMAHTQLTALHVSSCFYEARGAALRTLPALQRLQLRAPEGDGGYPVPPPLCHQLAGCTRLTSLSLEYCDCRDVPPGCWGCGAHAEVHASRVLGLPSLLQQPINLPPDPPVAWNHRRQHAERAAPAVAAPRLSARRQALDPAHHTARADAPGAEPMPPAGPALAPVPLHSPAKPVSGGKLGS